MMTTSTRRHSNPVAEVLSWFDLDAPFALRTDGTPRVRIEDYVEDGTYVLRAEVPDYGEFIRSVRLPDGSRTDDVDATYTDGFLEVRVPVATGRGTRTVPIVRKAD